MRKILSLVVVFSLGGLILPSCSSPRVDPEDVDATEISLSVRDTLTLTIGESAVLYASVNRDGLADRVSWLLPDDDIVGMEPSDVPSGQPAERTSAIKVTGLVLGNALVVAVLDNLDVSCVVKVVARSVEKLTLDKTSASLNVGDKDHLTATVSPSDATDQVIRWFSDDETVVTVAGAVVTALKAGTATVTASCGNCTASCVYTVSNIDPVSVSVDKTSLELTETETEIVNMTILPENVTLKDVVWKSSDEAVARVEFLDANPKDNVVSCIITAVAKGDAIIEASIGSLTANVTVRVNEKVVPVSDPVVGDYFYSDGTWSTGYPAPPVDGKTVIGIVFQTDPDRINETDRKDGYTHGYVACSQLVYNPVVPEGKEPDRTVMYSILDSFDVMGGSVLPYVWYRNVDGRNESNLVLEYANRTYGNYFNFPAFDFAMTDYRVTAPSGTSGWFIPSTGQVWDMLANLCGDEVRAFLREESGSEISVVYRYENTELSYDPIDRFNEWLSLVPADMKEEFFANYSADNVGSSGEFPFIDRRFCDIMTSTVCSYFEGEETIATFCIGKKVRKNKFKKVQDEVGYISLEEEWTNYSYVCRPILAF